MPFNFPWKFTGHLSSYCHKSPSFARKLLVHARSGESRAIARGALVASRKFRFAPGLGLVLAATNANSKWLPFLVSSTGEG